ncbi:MAG: VWA domain-containing protein [Myxococcota bacterium]
MNPSGDGLERAYSALDSIPEALFAPVVVNPVGALEDRVAGVLQWRTSLLMGQVPEQADWPGPGLHAALSQSVQALGVLAFTPGEPELVDAVLLDLVAVVAELGPAHDGRLQELLAAARAKTRRPFEEEAAAPGSSGGGTSTDVDGSKTGEARGGGDEDPGTDLGSAAGHQESGEAPGDGAVDPEQAERLLAEARALAEDDLVRSLSDRLDGRWAGRVQAWRRLADILGDLKMALSLGFDLARRVLRHTGWREVSRLQALLADLPQVQDLVRTLGRMNAPKGEEQASVLDEVVDPVRRVVEELRWVRSPRAPTEARGIERGDDISRMLPVEASLLSHSSLRLLWHARRAERGLSVYRYEGKLQERIRVQTESAPTERSSHTAPERGPVVICLDTSGSMQGAPEQVAKALVLAVARAAHDEGRACQVVLFSGPSDVEAIEVDLGPQGIGSLLGLLGRSFHGGTDVDAPLKLALDTLERQGWNRADLLMVSDGAFEVPEGLIEQARMATDRHDARIHGLLVGVQSSAAMQALCDPLHTFADWAAVGGVDGRG